MITIRPQSIIAKAGSGPPLYTTLLVVDSLHLVFARLLLPHIDPGISAMYVLAIGTLEVGLIGLFRKRVHIKTLRKHLWLFLSIGALVGASTNITYEAIALIDPGTGSLLAKTSIVFSLVLGILWLHERLTVAQGIGALVAIIGAIAIAFQPGNYLRLGSLLIVSSSFMYALHMAIVKRYSSRIELLDFFFFRLVCTTAFLFIFAASRQAFVWPKGLTWGLLVMVGTVDVVLSRTLFYVALRQVKMSLLSIVLTLSPVVAVLWSLALFGTVPTLPQLFGGAAVIGGVLSMTSQRGPRTAQQSDTKVCT